MAKKIWYLFYWIGPNFDRLPCIFHCITFLLHNSITFITWHTTIMTHTKNIIWQKMLSSSSSKRSHYEVCLFLTGTLLFKYHLQLPLFTYNFRNGHFFKKELVNHQLKVWSETILVHEKYGLENQALEVYNFWIARGKWEWMNLCCH